MRIPDLLVERNKMQKSIFTWKIAFLIAVAILIISYFSNSIGTSSIGTPQNIIASIRIEETITEDSKFEKMLEEIADDNAIKALLVNINSPGGISGAAEKIYHKLSIIKSKKPVVVLMGSVAASGGYMVALASNKIYALNSTITGSIGVIMQYPELVELANKAGIKFMSFRSGEYKALPNPMEPITDNAKQALMKVMNDTHQYFVKIVSDNRNIKLEDAEKIADGRVFTGRQALENKLIDEIGTSDNAISWLKEQKLVSSDAIVKPIRPRRTQDLLEFFTRGIDSAVKSSADYLMNKISNSQYEIK